jgi:hypothetical protein
MSEIRFIHREKNRFKTKVKLSILLIKIAISKRPIQATFDLEIELYALPS